MDEVLVKCNCTFVSDGGKTKKTGGLIPMSKKRAADFVRGGLGVIVNVNKNEEVQDNNEFEKLLSLESATPEIVNELVELGLTTIEDIANSEVSALKRVYGVGEATAKKLISSAIEQLNNE